jgi:hemoglobin-like flavoprotein
VTTEDYAPVVAALIWTLEKGLGPAFTSDVKAAWGEAYSTLAGAMQQV